MVVFVTFEHLKVFFFSTHKLRTPVYFQQMNMQISQPVNLPLLIFGTVTTGNAELIPGSGFG